MKDNDEIVTMLDSILREEEGKTLEFKENAASLNRILCTIVAYDIVNNSS